MGVSLSYDVFTQPQPQPQPQPLYLADTTWSPVERIRIYADNYDPATLLATLVPARAYKENPCFILFHPTDQAIDNENCEFNIDLSSMRQHILEQLGD